MFCPYNIWKHVYMLYEQQLFVHTTYGNVFYMLQGRKRFVHTIYGKIVHMLYIRLHYHCSFVQTDQINSILPCFIKLMWV